MEQQIRLHTYIKFAFWDRVKILFGCVAHVNTTVIVLQENPIEQYNSYSDTSVQPAPPGLFIKQDRPPFGYEVTA